MPSNQFQRRQLVCIDLKVPGGPGPGLLHATCQQTTVVLTGCQAGGLSRWLHWILRRAKSRGYGGLARGTLQTTHLEKFYKHIMSSNDEIGLGWGPGSGIL